MILSNIDKIKFDKEMIMLALDNENKDSISDYFHDLEYFTNFHEFIDDKEIVIKAIKKSRKTIFFASQRLKNNIGIIIEAFNSYSSPDNRIEFMDMVLSESKFKSVKSKKIPKKIVDSYNSFIT